VIGGFSFGCRGPIPKCVMSKVIAGLPFLRRHSGILNCLGNWGLFIVLFGRAIVFAMCFLPFGRAV
jgi:hypothetical protein